MKIAIDIGHSPKDGGAVTADRKVSEYTFMRVLSGVVATKLRALGHEVGVFNRGDHGNSVSREVSMINAYAPNVCVSLHANDSESNKASGSEVIHVSTKGRILGQCILTEVVKVLGLPDRGVKTPWQGRGNTFLKNTFAPAVIVEPFFIDNPADFKVAERLHVELGEAIAKGIHEFSLRG